MGRWREGLGRGQCGGTGSSEGQARLACGFCQQRVSSDFTLECDSESVEATKSVTLAKAYCQIGEHLQMTLRGPQASGICSGENDAHSGVLSLTGLSGHCCPGAESRQRCLLGVPSLSPGRECLSHTARHPKTLELSERPK